METIKAIGFCEARVACDTICCMVITDENIHSIEIETDRSEQHHVIDIVDKDNELIDKDQFIGAEIVRVFECGEVSGRYDYYPIDDFLEDYSFGFIVKFETSKGDFFVKALTDGDGVCPDMGYTKTPVS